MFVCGCSRCLSHNHLSIFRLTACAADIRLPLLLLRHLAWRPRRSRRRDQHFQHGRHQLQRHAGPALQQHRVRAAAAAATTNTSKHASIARMCAYTRRLAPSTTTSQFFYLAADAEVRSLTGRAHDALTVCACLQSARHAELANFFRSVDSTVNVANLTASINVCRRGADQRACVCWWCRRSARNRPPSRWRTWRRPCLSSRCRLTRSMCI